MPRKIIHVDMDAFFAAIEQRDFPQLRGKPIVVGGMPNSRGVVSTASYEARKFGIHSAMASARAFKLCPQAIFVKPRFNAYKEASDQIRQIFHQYTDLVEPLSLDEAFLDVSENKPGMDSAKEIAREILDKIKLTTQLSASAGVGPGKFVAKVASDFDKPGGITVVKPEGVLPFIHALPIRKFFGIGKKTEEKMKAHGIYTGKDLYGKELYWLQQHFGKVGKFYYDIVRGIDERPVKPTRIRKSIGVERTFKRDISTYADYQKSLEFLATELAGRIEKYKRFGNIIIVKTKDADFRVRNHQRKMPLLFKSREDIYENALALLRELIPDPLPLRLIGITITGFEENDPALRQDQASQMEITF
jgi:DNA polymerase-4